MIDVVNKARNVNQMAYDDMHYQSSKCQEEWRLGLMRRLRNYERL